MDLNPELAIWRGPPSKERVKIILLLTHTDDKAGKRYYRKNEISPWKRLRTQQDFDLLNKYIDEY